MHDTSVTLQQAWEPHRKGNVTWCVLSPLPLVWAGIWCVCVFDSRAERQLASAPVLFRPSSLPWHVIQGRATVVWISNAVATEPWEKRTVSHDCSGTLKHWPTCTASLFSFGTFTPFSPQFCDVQLVVTVLSYRCNSPTDSGEVKVDSHASSETLPCQAALLLDTLLTLHCLSVGINGTLHCDSYTHWG